MSKYPARALAALTGTGLLIAGAFLTTNIDLLVNNEIWRMLYTIAGLELLIIAVTPRPGLILRASTAGIATIVLLGRAMALAVDYVSSSAALGELSPFVAISAWVIIAAHTNTLLVFWPTLTASYIRRQ